MQKISVIEQGKEDEITKDSSANKLTLTDVTNDDSFSSVSKTDKIFKFERVVTNPISSCLQIKKSKKDKKCSICNKRAEKLSIK